MRPTAAPAIKFRDIFSILRQSPDGVSQDGLILTENGRTALHAALTSLRGRAAEKKWLFPAYCCPSVFQTFAAAGVPYELYPIDAEFRPSVPYLAERLSKGDIGGFLLIHYFGFRTDSPELMALLRRSGVAIIEDCAHMPMPEDRPFESDARIYSFRKWYPLPHGGGLAMKSGDASFSLSPVSGLELYRELTRAAVFRLEHLSGLNIRGRLLSLKRFARYLEFKDAENSRYGLAMHPKAAAYLRRRTPSTASVRERQRKNYFFLLEKFRKRAEFSVPRESLLDGECPFTFPILVRGGDRDRIYARCVRDGIPARIYWKFLPKEAKEDPLFGISRDLSERILCFPVHYELGESELMKISEGVAGD